MSRWWSFALAAALALAPVPAQSRAAPSTAEAVPSWVEPDASVALRATVDTEEVPLLGDVTLTLELWRRGDVAAGDLTGFAPEVPADFVGTVQVGSPQRIGPPDAPEGYLQRWVFALQPAALGEVSIPPFEVALPDGTAAGTDELVLQVSPVIPKPADPADGGDPGTGNLAPEAGAAPEAPAEPFRPPFSWRPWLWLPAVLAVVLLAWLLLRRARNRDLSAPSSVPLPAHVAALRELERLRAAPRDSREEIDAYYVAVSAVLRRYIEDRFGLRAPERTTEEFLRELEFHQRDGRRVFAPAERDALARFLEQCDLVKFANQVPGPDVHEAVRATAVEVVEATRPDRAAGEPAAGRRPEPLVEGVP